MDHHTWIAKLGTAEQMKSEVATALDEDDLKVIVDELHSLAPVTARELLVFVGAPPANSGKTDFSNEWFRSFWGPLSSSQLNQILARLSWVRMYARELRKHSAKLEAAPPRPDVYDQDLPLELMRAVLQERRGFACYQTLWGSGPVWRVSARFEGDLARDRKVRGENVIEASQLFRPTSSTSWLPPWIYVALARMLADSFHATLLLLATDPTVTISENVLPKSERLDLVEIYERLQRTHAAWYKLPTELPPEEEDAEPPFPSP